MAAPFHIGLFLVCLAWVEAETDTCLLQLRAAATPASPNRKLTQAEWSSAANKFVKIDSRRLGVEETLFAKPSFLGAPVHECGTPCVAHLIAGQPRNLVVEKGLYKSIKHRLFEKFSEKPVVFALLAVGGLEGNDDTIAHHEGAAGYVRTPQAEVQNEQMRESLLYLGVSRALLLREACTTGACLQKGLRLKCNAKDLNLTEYVDLDTGIYSNMCEIQVSRFRDGMELVRDYEDEHHFKFDWVTRPRPDVYFVRPAPAASMLATDHAHFSPWAACGYGGMDWFYALPRQHADTIANFASSVSCDDYKSSPEIGKRCWSCAGCECWMAAWMYAQKVPFKQLPWGWHTPAKFCGADQCPVDWVVTAQNVMGLDPRVAAEPCTVKGSSTSCPMLLQTTRVDTGKHSTLEDLY